jgi:hypothetical protein
MSKHRELIFSHETHPTRVGDWWHERTRFGASALSVASGAPEVRMADGCSALILLFSQSLACNGVLNLWIIKLQISISN